VYWLVLVVSGCGWEGGTGAVVCPLAPDLKIPRRVTDDTPKCRTNRCRRTAARLSVSRRCRQFKCQSVVHGFSRQLSLTSALVRADADFEVTDIAEGFIFERVGIGWGVFELAGLEHFDGEDDLGFEGIEEFDGG
jgi:hypothetical protein